jgi:glucose/arabinose dehydrogenase
MPGHVFLATPEVSADEADGTVIERIARTGPADAAVTVTYGLTAGTATEGADFVGGTGTVVIPAGADHVDLPIRILDDALPEPTEGFVLSIINVDGATLVAPRTSRVSILDDEAPAPPPDPTPALTPRYDVRQVPLVDGLDQPIRFAMSPVVPTQAYVAEKPGRTVLADLATGAVTPLLDISGAVNEHQDRGLLDIALDPDFGQNGHIYAFVVVDPPDTAGRTGNAGPDGAGNRYVQVLRFTADAAAGFAAIDPDSREVLLGGAGHTLEDISGAGALDFTEPDHADWPASDRWANPANPVAMEGGFKRDFVKADAASHQGGHLSFGPDGALYVAVGDSASFNYADPHAADVQALDSLSGKILRIDPETGAGLADNPFVAAGMDLQSNRARVYQLGLRNPFSMGFDHDGRLFIADTGWNTWEELNMAGPGANFGWPFYEGGDGGVSLRTDTWRETEAAAAFYAALEAGDAAVTAPFRAFPHEGAGTGIPNHAITSGEAVIGGDRYPADLHGGYLFTDFSNNRVFAVDVNDSGDVQYLFSGDSGYAPIDFAEGADGYVYYADLFAGAIGRLVIEPARGVALDGAGFDAPLIGGGGADTIRSGEGAPYMVGGAGAHTFVVEAGAGRITIGDFARGEDVLRFDGIAVSALTIEAHSYGGADGQIVRFDGGHVWLPGVHGLTAAELGAAAPAPTPTPAPAPGPGPAPTPTPTPGPGGTPPQPGAGGVLLDGAGSDAPLFGGAGDDVFVSGTGTPFMWGGSGSDTFVVDPGAPNGVTIDDFEAGRDHLRLRGYTAADVVFQAHTHDGRDGLLLNLDAAGRHVWLPNIPNATAIDSAFV